MKHIYRETWTILVSSYHWPKDEDPRAEALSAQGWDEIRRILLGYIEVWMLAAHIFTLDLEATLTAKVGSTWWSEDSVEAVLSFLGSL